MVNSPNSVPLVSVIIPLYNRAHAIERTLKSVHVQTFQDFEVVVVDDGSNDNPSVVIDSIGDPRIRLIRQDNRGGGSARNRGIDVARGQFVAFLDSDDVFLPDHLAKVVIRLADDPEVAVYSPVIVNRESNRCFLRPPRAIRLGENVADYLMRDRGFIPTSTLAVSAIKAKIVRYNEEIFYGQDTDCAIRLHLSGVNFIMLPSPGAIVDDSPSAHRLSVRRNLDAASIWLEDLRNSIPRRAYWGYRGWHIARHVAASDRVRALSMSVGAIRRGCYNPRLALTVIMQVALPQDSYRFLSRLILAAKPLLRVSGFRFTKLPSARDTD